MKRRQRYGHPLLTALSAFLLLGLAQARQSLPATDEAAAEAAALPPVSTTLTLSVPDQATETVVAQPLPVGVRYVPGSASLDGQSLPEPKLGAAKDGLQTLYFVIPGHAGGALHFDVQADAPLPGGNLPAASLEVRYGAGRSEVLTGTIDERDLLAAKPVQGAAAVERQGVIRSPLDALELRGQNSVNVTLEVPAESADAPGLLSVNGQPVADSRIGMRSVYADGHLRLTYIAVPLVVGTNVLTALNDRVEVVAGGPAAAVRVTPAALVADGSSPLVFRLDVRDAAGNAGDVPSVSVTTEGSEPLDADADPGQSGYQIKIEKGLGTLRLRPLSTPGTVTLRFDVNGHAQTETVKVGGNSSSFLIVHSGGLIDAEGATWTGAASVEAPVLGGKLYAAVNSSGVSQPPPTYERYPGYGDAASESVPLAAQGKAAARLDLPDVHAEYLKDAALDPIFGVHTGADGLNVETKGDLRVGASVTALPGDLTVVTLTPDGTRLLRLPDASAVPNSETLELVTSRGGVEVSRRTLLRGSEYVLDSGGLIEFAAPLSPVSVTGDDVRIVAHYRRGLGGNTSVTAGAHVTQDFRVGAVLGSVSAGLLRQADVTSLGVHGVVSGPLGAAEALIGMSGGLLVEAHGTLNSGALSADLTARREDPGYNGPRSAGKGTDLNASVGYALTPRFGVKLSATVQDDLTVDALSGQVTPSPLVAVVAAGVTYRADPWKAELLARRGFANGGAFGVQGLVGLTLPGGEVTLAHVQDFGQTAGQVVGQTLGQSLSTATAAVKLAPDLKLAFSVSEDWNSGKLAAGLALTGTRAGVNYTAGYDLPQDGGTLGRARLAATTSIPLAPGISAALSANAQTDSAGLSGAVGVSVRATTDTVQATLGADVAAGPTGLHFDVKSGLNWNLSKELTLTEDGLSDFAATSGHRYGVGLAWRGDGSSALAFLRLRTGSFGEDRLTAELSGSQRPNARLELREALSAALPLNVNGSNAATLLGQFGGRYWLTDRVAVGATARALYQVDSPLETGLGLEATVVPLPGWGVSVGYNFTGFVSDLGALPTRQGVYLRVDLMLDEVRR